MNYPLLRYLFGMILLIVAAFLVLPLAKIVLTADMLFGRLELFPMLILLMPSTWRKY